MAWSDNEGNVVKQLGRSLNMIRAAIDAGDVERVADHTRNMVADCAPYVKDRDKYKMPRNEDDEARIFDRCMEIKEDLLCEMMEKGIYAYKQEDPGDASSLALE